MDSNYFDNQTASPVEQKPVQDADNFGMQETAATESAPEQIMYQNTVYVQQGETSPTAATSAPKRCPGKEITGLVLGINALVWPIIGLCCCALPISGGILSIIYGLFGIGFGIAAAILYNKCIEQADYITKKITIGKKLGIAGIIVGAVGIVLGIVSICLWVGGLAYGLDNFF